MHSRQPNLLNGRVTSMLAGLMLFFIGSGIYASLRSTDLYMFSLWPSNTLPSWLYSWREMLAGLSVPEWFRYSLPDGLWLLAYMLLIDSIWGEERGLLRNIFLWSMPVIAIASEGLQAKHIIFGSGDWADVLFYILATIAFITIKQINHENRY